MADTRESILTRFLNIAGMTASEAECYEAGFDAALNGASQANSHFRFFRSRDRTTAWERGQHDGNQARKMVEANVKPGSASGGARHE